MLQFRAAAVLFLIAFAALSQESKPVEMGTAEERGYFPEAEFTMSSKFANANFTQPLWRGVEFGAHYFWVNEEELSNKHVSVWGAQWAWRRKGLTIAPGFGLTTGRAGDPGAAFTLTAEYERKHFVAYYSFIQSLTAGEGEHGGKTHGYISDGNHVSGVWKRLEVGGTWERIHMRVGNEAKCGVRVAVQLTKHLSFLAFVMGPDAEARFGLWLHPAKAE
jgi:hypothetical protein